MADFGTCLWPVVLSCDGVRLATVAVLGICLACCRHLAGYVFSALVGMARCAVPARVVAGGTHDRAALAVRKSCAAARGADIAARCPYHVNTYYSAGAGWHPG